MLSFSPQRLKPVIFDWLMDGLKAVAFRRVSSRADSAQHAGDQGINRDERRSYFFSKPVSAARDLFAVLLEV